MVDDDDVAMDSSVALLVCPFFSASSNLRSTLFHASPTLEKNPENGDDDMEIY